MRATEGTGFAGRLTAALLAVLMVVLVLPVNAIAFSLRGTGAVSVIVTDSETGAPVGGASIYLDTDLDSAAAMTNAQGLATITNFPDGTHSLVIVKKGYKSLTTERIAALDTAEEFAFEIDPMETVTVTGIVQSDSRLPLADAQVRVTGYCDYAATTDSMGRFTIENVFKGLFNDTEYAQYNVEIIKDGIRKNSTTLDLDHENVIHVVPVQAGDIFFETNSVELKYNEQRECLAHSSESTAVITYSSGNTAIVTVDEYGMLTAVGIGNTVITAHLEALEGEYDENEATLNVTVKKADQDPLNWTVSVPENLTWQDTFTNTVTGGSVPENAVVYSCTNGPKAQINSATGKLTFTAPCTTKVTAVKAGNEYYEEVRAEYEITVGKAEQTPLTFADAHPNALFVGETLENPASGGSVANSTIAYSAEKADGSFGPAAVSVDANGKVTASRRGVAIVTATAPGNDLYESVSASYTITVYEMGDKDAFVFVKGGGTHTIKYGEYFANPIMPVEGRTVNYSVEPAGIVTVGDFGVITTIKSGTVTITAVNADNSEETAHYELVVEKADQTVEFELNEIPVLNYHEYFTNTATAQTEITYSVAEGSEYVAINSATGEIYGKKVGTAIIRATAAANDCYNSAYAEYTVQVVPAVKDVVFDKANPSTVTFHDNGNQFQITAELDGIHAPGNEFTYTVVAGNDKATVDANTGLITILHATQTNAPIKIKAEFAGNENFAPASGVFELNVDPYQQVIEFVFAEGYDYYPVKTRGTAFVQAGPVQNTFFSDADITYSITSGNNLVKSTSYKDDGTFAVTVKGNTGTVKVKATKPGNGDYLEATKECSIIIDDNTWTAENVYKLEGEKKNDSGWFTGNVSVVLANGYSSYDYGLSLYNANQDDFEWSASLPDVATEQGANSFDFLVHKYSWWGWYDYGDTSAIIHKTVRIDSVAPAASFTITDMSGWTKVIQALTFGTRTEGKYTLAVNASDATSGVAEIKYYCAPADANVPLSAEALDAVDEASWIPLDSGANTFEVDKADVFRTYVKVYDVAGNYTYASRPDETAPNGTISIITSPVNPGGNTQPGNEGLFGGNVTLSLQVSDPAKSSGLKSIRYYIEKNDGDGYSVTDSGELYSYNPQEEDAYGDIITYWNSQTENKNVVVDAVVNDSDDVRVTFVASDNAGNTWTGIKTFSINGRDPMVIVEFDNNDFQHVSGSRAYFNAPRTATITIKERPSLINPDGIDLDACVVDWNGNNVDVDLTPVQISSNHEETKFRVSFSADANYTIYPRYTNNAGRTCESITYADSTKYPNLFTVDTGAPELSATIGANTWDMLLETLTFGLWTNDEFIVSSETVDAIGPVVHEYYRHTGNTALTVDELNAVTWTEYSGSMTESEEAQFTYYFRATDYSGNRKIVSTDGHIIDFTAPTVTITPEDTQIEIDGKGVYNRDVAVQIDIADAEIYSGIRSVEYWVECDGAETQRQTLYSFEYVRDTGDNSNGGTLNIYENGVLVSSQADHAPTQDELRHEFSASVVIDSMLNNSCDTVLHVEAYDNAGNCYHETLMVDIDIKAPVIDITYDNNEPFSITKDGSTYFPEPRTATVTFTERDHHFNETKANESIVINGVDSQGNAVDLDLDAMTNNWTWATIEGEKPDECKHVLTIYFGSDANYDFRINHDEEHTYVDEAGNPCTVVDPHDSVAPFVFTVDTTDPEGSVTIGEYTWNDILNTLTFGLWSNDKFVITSEAEDATSPLVHEYCKHDGDFAMTDADLEKAEWHIYEGAIEETEEQQFTYYFRITDYAGNRIYIDSDGHIIDKTPSAIELNIVNKTESNIYKEDVIVRIEVNDPECYSGIKKIEYWVTSDGVETQRQTLYSFEYDRDPGENSNGGTLRIYEDGQLVYDETGVVPTKEQLRHEFDENVTILSELNNNCDVVLYVGVTDNAGNYSQESVAVDIDITPPVIDISYDNNDPYKIENDRGYYPENRTATIVVTERTHHFDPEAVKNSIVVTGVNAEGEEVSFSLDKMTSDWSWSHEANPSDDELDTHTLTIAYTDDANYTFSINADEEHAYYDIAGNRCEVVDTGDSATPYTFTVDKVLPYGTVTVDAHGRWEETWGVWEDAWENIVEVLTFGLWSREPVSVSGKCDDETSPIESFSYYKIPDTELKTHEYLASLPGSAWTAFNDFDVVPNEQFVVYVKVVDYAGNTFYTSSNGVIVDNMAPVEESIAPEITVSPVQPVNDIYNTDVDVEVEVVDPIVGGTYSGLKEIRYEVYNLGSKTQEGVLYRFDTANPTQAQLLQSWKQTVAFTVDSAKNNSNNVEIKVYAVDNSDNASEQSTEIKIDITNPTISVRYDNNNGDTAFHDAQTDAFFKESRTATIVVTERNFDPKDVTVKITNTDGSIPSLVGWKTVPAGSNGDGTTHTATISYTADGDYTFDISCIDLAGNASEPVDYGNSLAPQKFTIDRTVPVVTIVYDNNDARNVNYYNKTRTATITVNEHNFEPSRVKIALTATDDGNPIALPKVSDWSNSGNTHVATIEYLADALYTFDFDYTDKAGNATANIDEHRFYVDTTMPMVQVMDIVDESANADKGNIGFTITAEDTNFDIFEPRLTVVVRNENGFETVDITDEGTFEEIKNGRIYEVENLADDGIYRLTCEVIDKAGNAYNKVILDNGDGTTSDTERAYPAELVTFSVNREGSTYEYGSDYCRGLAENFYVQSVRDDVVIVEINPDPLDEATFEIDLDYNESGANKLDSDKYNVEKTRGEGGNGWYKYTYTVPKELFDKEGEYRLMTKSVDKAGTPRSFSMDNGEFTRSDLTFLVDRTAPRVSISGISNDGRYQTDKLTVTLEPSDMPGQLKSIKVLLVDNNGETLSTLVNLEGEAFFDALENSENEGKISFELDEGLYQNVRIICDDAATYDPAVEENVIYDETVTNVSVASSAFLIYWANKPLRYGTMGGAGAVGLGAILLVLLKKRKKKEAK